MISIPRPWFVLERQLRPLHSKIVSDWKGMLKDATLSEHDYHAFLAEHAGLFFGDDRHRLFVVSKLQWANELVTDFVLANDEQSLGMSYELIEIESPHDRPFTIKGNASEALNAARQQVLDWKNWIAANRKMAMHLLPGSGRANFGELNFTRTIVIGNRENSEQFLAKRDAYAKDAGVTVRSFDWLTDRLKSRQFPIVPHLLSTELKSLDVATRNELANPFYEAMTDAEWRSVLSHGGFIPAAHVVAKHVQLFLAKRRHNGLLKDFDASVAQLPVADQNEVQEFITVCKKHGLL